MKPRILSQITLVFLLGTSSIAMSQSIAQKSMNNASEVIDAALEAYGGSDALSELKTITVSNTSENSAVGQSRRPGSPFDRDKTAGTAYIDFENKIFVTHTEGTGGGNQFDF